MSFRSVAQTAVALFVVMFVGEFLIHEVWLKGAYEATAAIWRPAESMKSFLGYMVAGYAIYSAMLTLLFSKGYSAVKSGLGQGFRFGLLIGALQAPLSSLIWYAVLPIPATLAAQWFVGNLALSVALGITAGLTYKE